MSRTLLDISEDLRALDDLLDECGGDITDPSVEAAVNQFFEELDRDLKGKADSYAALIREMEGRAAIRKEEASRLSGRAKQDESSAKWLKDRLMYVLDSRGIRSLETKRYKLGIQKNGGRQPLDIHVPAEQLPEKYQVQTIEADRAAIYADLQAGIEIPGCNLMERGESLRIR